MQSEPTAVALRELARAAEEPARTASTLARARVHFLDALALRAEARPTGLSPIRAMLLGFAASAAIVVCIAVLARRAPFVTPQRTGAAVTYSAEGVPGVMGAWHSAPAGTPLSLRFSEGTNLVLAANASLRVVRTDEHGATVALERGRLHARVQHREGTRWAVDAGPYHVRVTGTEFDVDWDPGTASFGIQLLAGSVQVTGCNAAGARVAGGQTLRLHCDSSDAPAVASNPAVERVEAPSEPRVTDAWRAGHAAEAHPDGKDPRATSPTALTDLPRESEPSQRRTAAAANTATEGTEAAHPAESASPSPKASAQAALDEQPAEKGAPQPEPQRADVAPTLEPASSARPVAACDPVPDRARAALGAAFESGTPDTAWAAIQCARRAGLSSAAEDALRDFRDRYGADPRRATAAFLLGKLTFARGAFSTAARWFDASRREAPSGQLARESAGRLIEAWQRSGEVGAAIRAAREYLTAYPEGPHARLARSLLAP